MVAFTLLLQVAYVIATSASWNDPVCSKASFEHTLTIASLSTATHDPTISFLFQTIWKYTGQLVTSRVTTAHLLASAGVPALIPAVDPNLFASPFPTRHNHEAAILGPYIADRERMFPAHLIPSRHMARYRLFSDVFEQVLGVAGSFHDDRQRVLDASLVPALSKKPTTPPLTDAQVLAYTEPPPTVFWFFVPNPALHRYAASIKLQLDPAMFPYDQSCRPSPFPHRVQSLHSPFCCL